jgi:ATP-dependent 26S proteasome regulatory subunit
VSRLADDVDLDAIARQHELAGGAIMNVICYCSLMALQRGGTEIASEDLERGIYREFSKEGRSGS